MAKATVQFYGDWNRMDSFLERIGYGGTQDDFEDALRSLGEAVRLLIVRRIENGDAVWPPLAPITIRRKGHPQVYVETGKFLASIRVEIVKKSSGILEVQIAPEGVNDQGVSYTDIANWLEYGTSRIPARPLWRPIMSRIPRLKEFTQLNRLLMQRARKL